MAGDLIHNERTKPIANALDRASTSCVTVGVAAPLAGYVYGLNHFAVWYHFSVWYWAGAGLAWIAGATIPHLAARQALGRLQS
jgi:hypothetical protein